MSRRFMLLGVFLFALLSIVVPSTLAYPTTENATPTVNVTFTESVRILGANITGKTGIIDTAVLNPDRANIGLNAGQFIKFLVAVVRHIDNGNYTLRINVADIAGNAAPYNFTFTVNAPVQKITLETPPNGGIRNQSSVNLTVITEFPSICHWKDNALAMPDKETFGIMRPFQDTTGGLRHNASEILAILKKNLVPNEELPIAVTCFDGQTYTGVVFRLVYLTEKPVVTVSQNPTPITDPYNPTTAITVAGTQKIWCKEITLPPNVGGVASFGPDDYWSYNRSITTLYTDAPQDEITLRNITLQCANQAGMWVESNYTIPIRYTDPIVITFTSPTITNDKTYTLKFTTNKLAGCTADVDKSPLFFATPAGEPWGSSFVARNTNLTNTKTTFTVRCVTPFKGDTTASLVVIRDSTAPLLTAITSDPNTCDLRKIRFAVNATDGDGSGIGIIQYSVKTSNETLIAPRNETVNGDLEIETPTIKLVNNSQITITVQVYDKAGNPSINKVDKTIKATDATPLTCDKTPPEVAVLQRPIATGTNVTLYCYDKQSGCTDTYQYALTTVASGKMCSPENVSQTASVGSMIVVTQPSYFCYSVKDKGGNIQKGQQRITTNGTLPGIPPKPPVNGTCSNSIKDQDESDVDCGGYACGILQRKLCIAGKACASSSDCTSAVCTANICASSSCQDGTKDGDETDTDCGGTCTERCSEGLRCKLNSDCVSGTKCIEDYCSEPPQEENPEPTPETTTDTGSNLLRLLFIILGSLTTLGGAGYSVLYKPPTVRPSSGASGAYNSGTTRPIARFKEPGSEHGDDLSSRSGTPQKERRVQATKARERHEKERESAVAAFASAEDVTKLPTVTHKDVEKAFKDLDHDDATDAIKQLISDDKVTPKDISIALKDLESGGHLDTDAINDLKKEFDLGGKKK